MPPKIHKFVSDEEFATDELCFITEVLNDESSPELSVARARVEPGVTTAWHRLTGTAERYLIFSGSGRMETEGIEPADVCAGDVVCIPPDTAQRITNTGAEDLIFFAVCTPRFTPECYIGLE
jgi:mannose-6-phosphate isomerase-like protein (cupin superfamily)